MSNDYVPVGNWKAYAAAAGASLAMATNASADIVWSGYIDATASISPTALASDAFTSGTIGGFHAVLGVGGFRSLSGSPGSTFTAGREAGAFVFGDLKINDSFGSSFGGHAAAWPSEPRPSRPAAAGCVFVR